MTTKEHATIDEVLAFAYAHSNQGTHYIPATNRDWEETTIDKVKISLFAGPEVLAEMTQEGRDYYEGKRKEAAGYLADTELMAAIKVSALSLRETTRYGSDVRNVLINGKDVSGRQIGLMASLVGVYSREKERREMQSKLPKMVKGYLGNVGERLHDVKLTLQTVRFIDNYFGGSTFLVGVTDDGHTVVWRASRSHDIKEGERITLASATIKALEKYQSKKETDQEVYQTVVTRAVVAQ